MVKDTGERIIPAYMKPSNGLLLEHLARYDFAKPYVRGRVLDLACGSGYGTAKIAKARKKEITEIIGVDVDEEIIHFAHKEYYHPLMTFKVADGTSPDLIDQLGTFDSILSFETIEHVPDDRAFFKQLMSLLNPGGYLVMSTPFGRGRGVSSRSPFHYYELTEKELTELVNDPASGVKSTMIYYQNSVALEREKREGVHYPIAVVVIQKTV
ncbi:class I SAM-dependent methyltransferase [Salisediminibacterium beveridgei]|uniref:Methyltransferase domain-containing protein n=1 Tax=Salisediminibacterium beveridgei TaxID=632773 RepID=A0A1D7QYV8_9BACI|nr:class I SAM-dependent methyltransferase [Salisediminibacterium beveridgei]AOM84168.1 hypothetical protein BBEV_2843 [Salisediminibacterium beveridgei]